MLSDGSLFSRAGMIIQARLCWTVQPARTSLGIRAKPWCATQPVRDIAQLPPRSHPTCVIDLSPDEIKQLPFVACEFTLCRIYSNVSNF